MMSEWLAWKKKRIITGSKALATQVSHSYACSTQVYFS
jgi:hypothetical protein